MSPTGRLAPSPTGYLHLGHARSFLLAYWHARSRAGRLVLRLEDFDVERIQPGAIEATLRDLEWLGVEWDGAPIIQSSGREQIEAAALELLQRGLAYPCTCTRREIQEALSAPQEGVEKARYPGTCRERYASLEAARAQSGREPALRLRVPSGPLALHDEFCGDFVNDVALEVGDFPILSRMGHPSYQLAVVVDDARMGVDEVVRGADLLSSVARQWYLQRALQLPHPRWWHVPLVVDEAGRRYAKRTQALSLQELRQRGLDPQRLVAWIAQHSGMDCGPRASARELTAQFDMQRVPRAALVCGQAELAALFP